MTEQTAPVQDDKPEAPEGAIEALMDQGYSRDDAIAMLVSEGYKVNEQA